MKLTIGLVLCSFASSYFSCTRAQRAAQEKEQAESSATIPSGSTNSTAPKLLLEDTECVDPDLERLSVGEQITLCNGTVGVGRLDIHPWNIRVGVEVAGVTGMLKSNCRNLGNGVWDYTTVPAAVGGDIYDSVDDYNNDSGNYPAVNIFQSESHVCGGPSVETATIEANFVKKNIGSDVVLLEKNSLTMVTPIKVGAVDWGNAISYCDGLVHAGFEDWYLPTQKHLSLLAVYGLYDFHNDGDIGDFEADNFWSSTTFSPNTVNAWSINFDAIFQHSENKSELNLVVCTRDATIAEF